MIEKAILKTLVYADIFSYPLTFSQIHKFLIAPKKVKREKVERCLKRMEKERKLEFNDGFYFLPGRAGLVKERRERELISQRKFNLAKKIAFFFKIIPFVKFVGITGKLAVGNCKVEDDLDFLLISGRNRLWLTRLALVLLLEILGVRRRPKEKEVKNKACLNVFLEEGFLALPKEERNLYTAHEIVQMKPIWEREDVYQKFLKANEWVKRYLPNAIGRIVETKEEKEDFQPSPFNFLESLAQKIQLWYLERHKTTERVGVHYAFFHPKSAKDWILAEYKKRIEEFGLGD